MWAGDSRQYPGYGGAALHSTAAIALGGRKRVPGPAGGEAVATAVPDQSQRCVSHQGKQKNLKNGKGKQKLLRKMVKVKKIV